MNCLRCGEMKEIKGHSPVCAQCRAEMLLLGEGRKLVELERRGLMVGERCEGCGKVEGYDPTSENPVSLCDKCRRMICASCTVSGPEINGRCCRACVAEAVLKDEKVDS